MLILGFQFFESQCRYLHCEAKKCTVLIFAVTLAVAQKLSKYNAV